MRKPRRSYTNPQWHEYAKKIRERDNNECLKCNRNQDEVVLQVHNKKYIPGLKPWEYSFSDCITLCKGCRAEEHKLIEPSRGWILIAVNDLGGLYGVCERRDCGTGIRYEHEVYHPGWGYKVVGSSCIEFLTKEDKYLSSRILKIYRNLSKFVHESVWISGYTRKGKKYFETKYKHHILRIYGEEKRYGFQIALKVKGARWYDWKDVILTRNKTFDQVKEMAAIVIKGIIAKEESEKEILRNIYKKIR